MDLQTILFIVTGILTVAGTFFGVKSELVKTKLNQVKDVMKEATDVMIVAAAAAADNKISLEEGEQIKKETLEMVGAFKVLIGK